MIKKITFVFFGILVGILFFEVILRVFDSYRSAPQLFVDTTKTIYAYDSALGWRLVPRTSGQEKRTEFDVTYTINGQGFRDDRDYPTMSSSSKKRIIFFGDSFTFGVGVPNNQTIPKVLEEEAGYDVLNFGISGYDIGQYYLLLKKEGLRYNPDIVVYDIYLGNDIEDVRLPHPYQSSKLKPYFAVDSGQLVLRGVPVPLDSSSSTAAVVDYRVKNIAFYNSIRWVFDLKTVLLWKNLLKQNFHPFLARWGFVKSISDYQENFSIIEKLLAETQTVLSGKKFIVLIIPSKNIKYNYLEKEFGKKLESILQEQNILFVNLTSLVINGSNFYFPLEGHLNEKGYQLAADALSNLSLIKNR